MHKGLLTSIIIGTVLVVFTIQNNVEVPVKLFFWRFESAPLPLVLLIAFLAGIALATVFAYIDKKKLELKYMRLKQKGSKEEGSENRSYEAPHSEKEDQDDEMELKGDPGVRFFDE